MHIYVYTFTALVPCIVSAVTVLNYIKQNIHVAIMPYLQIIFILMHIKVDDMHAYRNILSYTC